MLDQHLSDDDDDDDVSREVSNVYYVFVRANVLCRKFSRCSINVKIQILKSHCLCLYGTALWRCYKIGTMGGASGGEGGQLPPCAPALPPV